MNPTRHRYRHRFYPLTPRLALIVHHRSIFTPALTVVGDIHGQLEDLLHILDTCGSPNDKNFYIFNGDWVDRGNQVGPSSAGG